VIEAAETGIARPKKGQQQKRDAPANTRDPFDLSSSDEKARKRTRSTPKPKTKRSRRLHTRTVTMSGMISRAMNSSSLVTSPYMLPLGNVRLSFLIVIVTTPGSESREDIKYAPDNLNTFQIDSRR
jgi:Tfp pilus assembly protein PilP